MILLTVYRTQEGKREKREFAGLQEAIEFGQQSGADYEIYDPMTGQVIDWNQVNVKEEEDWYYDEQEYLWKKPGPEDGFYNNISFIHNSFGGRKNRTLSLCGSAN